MRAHAVPTSLTPASLWQTPASWQDHYSEHAMRCGKNCGLNPDPAFRKDVRAASNFALPVAAHRLGTRSLRLSLTCC